MSRSARARLTGRSRRGERAIRVFISSTWQDLQPERLALERALGRLPDATFAGMEYFGSRPETTREVSLAEVDRAELYIGIFAHRYGSGITEAEYRRAAERGLPLLLYFKDDQVAVLPAHVEQRARQAGQLRLLKRELQRRHTISVFTSPDHLATLVVADLYNQLAPASPPTVGPSPRPINPFTWRGGITRAEAFFGRRSEEHRLRDYLHNRQSCQIVGPRRIGKTSLHRQLLRRIPEWQPTALVAYLDLQDPRCGTLPGWLRQVGQGFGWPDPPADLIDLAERIEALLAAGRQPILCLEEFEAVALRPDEFDLTFLETLRSLGQRGLAMITSSGTELSRLTRRDDPRHGSPFFNIFSLLPLGPFAEDEAAEYLAQPRPGLPAFVEGERNAILHFARSHPLALQVACYHTLEARFDGDSPAAALELAAQEMTAYLPVW